MFGLGKGKANVTYGVLYDIGSESVGVAIVESEQNNQYPKVIFSHRVHMRVTKKEQTMPERVRNMREALFSASLIISRDGIQALSAYKPHARITKILLTVSAPWSHTIARNVRYEGERELKITRALIDDLIVSAEAEIATHIKEAYGNSLLDYEIIERATVDVRINDYAITEPLGLHGKEISLVHVTGIVPTEILNAVKEVEEKIFPDTTIHAHTFLLTLYCVLRDIYSEHRALTIIHVTGESTEVGIIENGTLTESISIPTGLNNVVRTLMNKNEQTPKEIHSELTLYTEGSLAADRAKAVEQSLLEYAKSVTEVLREHAEIRRFPKQAFILAPLTFTALFKKVLTPILKDELSITGEALTMKEDVLNLFQEGDAEDINISITSRFFHKLQGCGEIKEQ